MYLKTFDDMKKSSAFFMLKPAKAVYVFILTVCITIGIALLWAGLFPMDDVVKADVMLRTKESSSVIKSLTSGQVINKNYSNNDYVQEGQVLLRLDDLMLQKELKALISQKEQAYKELVKNKSRLSVIREQKSAPIYEELSEETQMEIKAFVKEYEYQKNQYEYSVKEAEKQLKRETSQDKMLRIKQKEEDLNYALQKAELDYTQWKNEQLLNAIENINTMQVRLESLETSIEEMNRSIKNARITSPISGKLTEVVKLNNGDNVLAGEELLKITPSQIDDKTGGSETLIAELYIDSLYASLIKVGNAVRIKFPGLPPSQFGLVETVIQKLSADSVLINGQYCYVAECPVPDANLKAINGKSAQLLPGLTAQARITVDSTTILKMIFKKLDFMK